ncbi:hypothetical protein [Corynebacterium alimapuense]|uniref:Uncharacterized protein n=1 Tax=Corynebacterium alimapuense TaxID=1576874 RepID=A0A3M8K669_9CORY|nr:hypothetical protein [Corynebacterium alimapuense]RNE48711.1 hypothetical protein C5L39_05185 [Corynebacterium alimapuense]
MRLKLRSADFFSESAVYGLVMVSAFLMVTNRSDVTSRDVFIKVLVAVVVLWIAHMFAAGVAHLSKVANSEAPLLESARYAFSHSLGMLLAAILPLAIIFLGVVNLIRDDIALWTALWVDVALLGLLGYLSTTAWAQKPFLRWAVGGATALLGVSIVILKTLAY